MQTKPYSLTQYVDAGCPTLTRGTRLTPVGVLIHQATGGMSCNECFMQVTNCPAFKKLNTQLLANQKSSIQRQFAKSPLDAESVLVKCAGRESNNPVTPPQPCRHNNMHGNYALTGHQATRCAGFICTATLKGNTVKTYTMNEDQLRLVHATANILLTAGDSNSQYLGQKLFDTVQQVTDQKVTDQKVTDQEAATSMTLQRYLRIARDASNYPQVPRITCKDGFSMSVQASSAHYCSPRNNQGPYTEVEVGYPSDVPHGIMQYCEDSDSPTNTVYAYVPIEKVEALIALHGGSDFSARR